MNRKGVSISIDIPAREHEKPRDTWAIAFHGGAGNLPVEMDPDRRENYRTSLRRVLDVGKQVLESGGSALDAVEAAVIALEDDPLYNAGKGAYFNLAGTHELDASIMEGSNLRCGAVAGVRHVKNPIRAARLVMERTPHVLLAGESAERLALDAGCERAEAAYFYTDHAFGVLQRAMKAAGIAPLDRPAYQNAPPNIDSPPEAPDIGENVGGTVGCVALDRFGNLAAATSTGGSPGKQPGRIGDSPIIGAGNLATPRCAVSCTGKGEEFIRHSIAARVAWLLEDRHVALEEALRFCLDDILPDNAGGMVAVDRSGAVSLQATTTAMPRGLATASGRYEIGIWMLDFLK